MVESAKQLEPDYSKMDYRYMGNTGLKVSVMGYGNWLNSNDASAQKFTTDAIKECLSMGVNFFDTAEIYGFGEAET
jgi:aryl-alcohol dehydrogenase-like predicted oxidoreductase